MKIARLSLAIALIAAFLLLVAGPGHRLELWSFGTGFQMMRWAAYAGLAAAGLAALFLLIPKTRSGNGAWLALALVIGAVAAWIPWQGLKQARAVPAIHDISTDTQNPPEFRAVLPLRGEQSNPVDYQDPEVPAKQHQAYPDIQPLELAADPAAAFDQALAAAEAMGWEIVAAEPAAGRIEATATTFWFGFKDDVVIRVTESEAGSRVDMRSTSRVGRSDVGANAERIRKYFRRLEG